MKTDQIVAGIDAEIARLQRAKALLSGVATPLKRKRGRPVGSGSSAKALHSITKQVVNAPKARRTMSAEGRARVAAAQRKRWANARKVGEKTSAAAIVKPRSAKNATKG